MLHDLGKALSGFSKIVDYIFSHKQAKSHQRARRAAVGCSGGAVTFVTKLNANITIYWLNMAGGGGDRTAQRAVAVVIRIIIHLVEIALNNHLNSYSSFALALCISLFLICFTHISVHCLAIRTKQGFSFPCYHACTSRFDSVILGGVMLVPMCFGNVF